MTRHDPRVRVRHMLDHAREAVEMIRGRCREDLDADRMLNLSLVRLVEVIGEAAAHLSPEFRQRYPNVSWREAVGMRHKLIHGYDKVDFDILWAIVLDDLPKLLVQLESILAAEGE